MRRAAVVLVLGMDQIMMNVRLLPWPDEKIFLNSYRRVGLGHSKDSVLSSPDLQRVPSKFINFRLSPA